MRCTYLNAALLAIDLGVYAVEALRRIPMLVAVLSMSHSTAAGRPTTPPAAGSVVAEVMGTAAV